MRIFMFKSEVRLALNAFAADEAGSALPANHGPWTATGVIGPKAVPPHGIARGTVEQANRDARLSNVAACKEGHR